MKLKEVHAGEILDSRKDKTIEVSVKTNFGIFSSSSPSGKSKGKHEARSYIESIAKDIGVLENTKFDFSIESFNDLEKVEKELKGKIGANSLFALESSILKALALEQGKELWQLINENARKFPYPVGNCIGGGLHSRSLNFSKPDFQEFLVIPKSRKFVDNVFLMKKAREICGKTLKLRKALGSLNDENAFSTNLENEEVLDVINKAREELENEGEKVEIGVDVASSTFFTGLIYNYKNPVKRLGKDKQLEYIKRLIENFRLGYIEDAFYEEDFESFAELREKTMKSRACLIVGDDLIASQVERLKKALINRSINSVIVKPNQVGSLIEIKKLVELARKYEIATIFSHRSGETLDYSIADLAFGFQADFVKFGIVGREREIKLRRLVEIEKNLQ